MLHWTRVRETWPGNLSQKQPVAGTRRRVALLQNDVTHGMTTQLLAWLWERSGLIGSFSYGGVRFRHALFISRAGLRCCLYSPSSRLFLVLCHSLPLLQWCWCRCSKSHIVNWITEVELKKKVMKKDQFADLVYRPTERCISTTEGIKLRHWDRSLSNWLLMEKI